MQRLGSKKQPLFLLFAAALLSHFLIRIFGSLSLELDAAEQAHLASYPLSWGYQLDQPPLFTWVTHGLFALFAPSHFLLHAFNYSLMAATVCALYRLAGKLMKNREWHLLATASYLSIWVFAYHMHRGFSHTLLLQLAITLTADALFTLEKHPRKGALYLCGALTLGFYSKYSYFFFLALFTGAALSLPRYRKLLLRPYPLSAFVGASLLLLPHLMWLHEHRLRSSTLIDGKLNPIFWPTWGEQAYTLARFVETSFGFLFPLFFCALYSFPRLFHWPEATSDRERLIRRFFIALGLLFAAVSFFVAMPRFKARWFHPLLFLAPLLFHLIGEKGPVRKHGLLVMWGCAIGTSIVSFGYHVETFFFAPYFGHSGKPNWPIVETIHSLPIEWSKSRVIVPDPYLYAHFYLHTEPKELKEHGEGEVVAWSSPYMEPTQWLEKEGLVESVETTTVTANGVPFSIHYLWLPADKAMPQGKQGKHLGIGG